MLCTWWKIKMIPSQIHVFLWTANDNTSYFFHNMPGLTRLPASFWPLISAITSCYQKLNRNSTWPSKLSTYKVPLDLESTSSAYEINIISTPKSRLQSQPPNLTWPFNPAGLLIRPHSLPYW
jgi:hypothetical protein